MVHKRNFVDRVVRTYTTEITDFDSKKEVIYYLFAKNFHLMPEQVDKLPNWRVEAWLSLLATDKKIDQALMLKLTKR